MSDDFSFDTDNPTQSFYRATANIGCRLGQTLSLCLVANAAVAQSGWAPTDRDLEVLDALGGYGCTLGDDSLEGLVGLGIAFDDVQSTLAKVQAAGAANWQGRFVVLSDEVCTIRLPEIESRWSPSDPEILARAPFTREEYALGGEMTVDEGCFLMNANAVFTELNGGDEEAGFADYLAFTGAGVISGEVRFYADSPLRVPPSFQIMIGDECRQGDNIAELDATLPYIADGFGTFVRAAFETNTCQDGGFLAPPDDIMGVQGIDTSRDLDEQGPANSSIWVEWTHVALAAGWFEGAGANEKGRPRPPLCHYR